MPTTEETVQKLLEILRPLKGTGSADHDEDIDIRNPDRPIITAVSMALAELEIDGLGGCPLCAA